MKIGLLSLPLNWNYGGILQQYALKETLQGMGHVVTIFSRRMDRDGMLRRAPVCFKWKTLSYLAYIPFLRFLPLIGVQDFKRRHLTNLTGEIFDDATARKLSVDLALKAFVVGSDQVWNRTATPKLYNYYLDFTHEIPDVRRIAYAASFGKSEWDYSEAETKMCAELAQSFDAISVREDSGVTLCREKLGVAAVHMPDPTLLLKKEQYQAVISGARICTQPNSLLTYILDDSEYKRIVVSGVAKALTLDVVELMPQGIGATIKEAFKGKRATVEQWLSSFDSADFVVTDSFHGTLFSIKFNKPFIAIANEARGVARFQSFLKLVGLEDRLVFEEGDYSELLARPIDWVEVNRKVEEQSQQAYEFIELGLEGNSNGH
jgi:hypothetical protein